MLQITKKIIGHLNKCYSMAPLTIDGNRCFLTAAEKQDPCHVFSLDGQLLDTVWQQPGGVMTMVQLPNDSGAFLATHRFYSPNDSKDATIVQAVPGQDGSWNIQTLCKAPFVHRFGIVERNGVHHLIVCCLKSDHEYKEDWRFPGAIYTAVLPEDLSVYNDENPLPLQLVKGGLLKNHGYSQVEIDGITRCVVGTQNGTLLLTPPESANQPWTCQTLCTMPSSDSVLLDFDGDGQLELGVIESFHGNRLHIFHLNENGEYEKVWSLPFEESVSEMIHATWAGRLQSGRPVWCVGWRKGNRQSVLIRYDAAKHDYAVETIDVNAGAANFMHLVNDQMQDVLVATNREIDEIAMYTLEERE